MTESLDLVVLVADADAEWTLRTLLTERVPALQMRPIAFQVIRHPDRDPGVFQRGPEFLRIYLRQARHAIIMLDREGSGREQSTAEEMEADLESRLRQNGWTKETGQLRAAAIVLDPELEAWVWSRSPHVAEALGLTGVELQQVLNSSELAENGKPKRPKETMLTALRRGGRPHSASVFQELARRVSLHSQERAFDKLRRTLQGWFPADQRR